MSLSKIVSEATEANQADGTINRNGAINQAVPLVLADPEMTETCVRGHLSRLIATNAKARFREDRASVRQGSIFGLREAHVVDDGEGSIKHTRALNRLEFAALIKVRETQAVDDQAYLDKLKTAASETARLWDRHPNWLWGQVEDAYARQREAA